MNGSHSLRMLLTEHSNFVSDLLWLNMKTEIIMGSIDMDILYVHHAMRMRVKVFDCGALRRAWWYCVCAYARRQQPKVKLVINWI